MKFGRFLSSKSIPLCVIGFSLVLWCIFAALAGIQWIFIGITVLAVFAATALWIICEYFYVKKRLKKLDRLCKELETGYLLGEVLPLPVTPLEEEYFAVMKHVSRSAISKIEELSTEQEEYRDYVERWIHEIKTPLTASSLILANGGDVRKLKTELKRAENLTESILYCARMRTVAADTQITQISARDAVDEAVKNEMELLLAAGIGVEVEGDFTAYTDKKTLVFILKQLLVNCSKYCPASHVKITASAGTVCVADDGPGILPHELPRIFSRGFVGKEGRKYGAGTGMGLFLVHELCQKHGIKLDVQSKEGQGAKFFLTFQK